jgi:hypothetical protein
VQREIGSTPTPRNAVEEITMSKYRKKPVEIDAVQFTGGAESATRVIDWVLAGGGTARYHGLVAAQEFGDGKGHPADDEHVSINTLEGTMRASVGDWVIRGVQGEHYPCKPDIFAATYDRPTVAPLDAVEPITPERVQAAVDALGVGIPLLDMRSLQLDADGMTIVALSKDAQGKPQVSGNSLATYTVTVPWAPAVLRADQSVGRG